MLKLLGLVLLQIQLSQPCGPHSEWVTRLLTVYGEERVWMGLSGPRIMFELFMNHESQTWTILRTNPTGLSCLQASGFGGELKAQGIET